MLAAPVAVQAPFWQAVHKLPWWVRRWVCRLCADFGTDPKKVGPNFFWVPATGSPLQMICIDCGKAQTHRVCSECFYGKADNMRPDFL